MGYVLGWTSNYINVFYGLFDFVLVFVRIKKELYIQEEQACTLKLEDGNRVSIQLVENFIFYLPTAIMTFHAHDGVFHCLATTA